MHEQQRRILDHERRMAHELALMVLDKPKPPLWMIFVPVFFIFFAQKMNAYSQGRKTFVDNYLVSRQRALDAAYTAVETGQPVDMEQFANVVTLPDGARDAYKKWARLLIEHYRTLLTAPGDSLAAMVRAEFKTKTDYLLVRNSLNAAENAFNLTLVPEIHDDSQDVMHIVKKMHRGAAELTRREADTFFA